MSGYTNFLPKDFRYGFATAAFQIEGGASEGGKGPSVWDTVSQKTAKSADPDSGVGVGGVDSYHQYKEDIRLLSSYGANSYRFSIAWTRIIPLGGRDDPVNEAGLKFYEDMVDECLRNGVEPWVTLSHWDLPQALEDRYGGWSNAEEICKDFVRYADVVFQRLGGKVKNWITLNEPIAVLLMTALGLKPNFNAAVDPWLLTHSQILAHAYAVDLYRTKYKPTQHGQIGITLSCDWCEPLEEKEEACREMAQRRLDFFFGRFADPIYLGRFPSSILETAGSALPTYTPAQWSLIHGSCDFMGFNSYSTDYATGEMDPVEKRGSVFSQIGGAVVVAHKKDGVEIGPIGNSWYSHDVPWGFRKMLAYLHKRYDTNKFPMYITENGWNIKDENLLSLEDSVRDQGRVDFFRGYLGAMCEAMKEDGVNCKGYFGWSLLDNMEWYHGYKVKYGVTHVDKENNFKRTPKDSSQFLKGWFEDAIAK